MGGVCGDEQKPGLSTNTDIFFQSIKYYSSERDLITGNQIEVYSYKQIFIQRKLYSLATKDQLGELSQFFSIYSKCPAGIQAIFSLSSGKDIKIQTNYSMSVFSEHLNYTLKMHLERMRFKGVSLSVKEVFYILREFVRAGAYFWMNGFWVKSFDSTDLFLSSAYEVKIPYENVGGPSLFNSSLGNMLSFCPTRQTLYLSPQQMSERAKEGEGRGLRLKSGEIDRVFSLGMLILECSTMLDATVTYYNYQRHAINAEKMRADIECLKDRRLGDILQRMLDTDPRKRIRFKQIEEIIQKMDESMFQQYLLFD